MNNLYFLRKQFNSAVGYEGDSFNSREFMNEFFEWVVLRYSLLGDYVKILEDSNINFDNSYSAEVGKGSFDSVVLPFKTSIITPFIDDFADNLDMFDLENRIIPGDLVVYNDIPRLVYSKKKDDFADIKPFDYNTFLTQNPYSINNVYGWDKLHNSGFYNIVVGIYGNNYDKDMNSKIENLINFRKLLDPETYKEFYSEFGDSYYYIVSSDNKKRVRKR